MVLLNTNILIEILKGNRACINKVNSFDTKLAISSISVMELYFGARNKLELKQLEQFVNLFKIEHLSKTISIKASLLVKLYAKSHSLDIPDSLIAATALTNNASLFSLNKDFKYIPKLLLI